MTRIPIYIDFAEGKVVEFAEGDTFPEYITSGITSGITSTNEYGGAKAVADSDYTILPTDSLLLLPDPASSRTLTLPAASTMQNKIIKIKNFATSVGEWVLSGSWIQSTKTGAMTEDFVNSGLQAAEVIILQSADVGGGTWKWIRLL